jgi:hypothetical protein
MIALIAGILIYAKMVKDKMMSRNVDDDPNSIIGSDPQPKMGSRYER